MSLDPVFNPTRVAVVGASDRPGKVGSVIWRNLSGFDGEVIPVTTSAEQVGGVPTVAALTEIEGRVDLAILATPARA
ncbi:MAG: acyl-CoA synthetase (NDP forming), partial [Acidimicrobiia bacterium]|nr:acyl-CoA synthetase (NDP forming) [Acidimicrobiia bacterium]